MKPRHIGKIGLISTLVLALVLIPGASFGLTNSTNSTNSTVTNSTNSTIPDVINGTNISNFTAPTIPHWVKAVAAYWASGQLTDQEFQQAIQFLVDTDIIKVNSTAAMSILGTPSAATVDVVSNATETNSTLVNSTQINSTKIVPVFTIHDIENASSNWFTGNMTDHDFYNIVQKAIDSGLIGPFQGPQNRTLATLSTEQPIEPNHVIVNVNIPVQNNFLTVNAGDIVNFTNTSKDIMYGLQKNNPDFSSVEVRSLTLPPIGDNSPGVHSFQTYNIPTDYNFTIIGYHSNDVSNYVPESYIFIHSIMPIKTQSADFIDPAKNMALIYSKTHQKSDLENLAQQLYKIGLVNNTKS